MSPAILTFQASLCDYWLTATSNSEAQAISIQHISNNKSTATANNCSVLYTDTIKHNHANGREHWTTANKTRINEKNSGTEHNWRKYDDLKTRLVGMPPTGNSSFSSKHQLQSHWHCSIIAHWQQISLSMQTQIKKLLILYRTFYSCQSFLQVVNVRHLICGNITSLYRCRNVWIFCILWNITRQ